MQVTELAAEGLKRAFTVVVPATDIAAARDQRLATLAKDMRLPGFRPGKVPMSVVKQRYGSAVMGEVLEEQVQSVTKAVIDERGLRPAMQPKIELVNFAEGADLEFKVELEQLPEIPMPDFAAIALEKPVAKVGDDEVTKALAGIASRNRAMEPVTEDRAAAIGDVVVADFCGRVKLGEELLPPVAEGSEPGWKISAANSQATLVAIPGGAEVRVSAGATAARVTFASAVKVAAGERLSLTFKWQATSGVPVAGRNSAILFDMEDAAGKPLKTERVEIAMVEAENAVATGSWTAPELEGLAAVKVGLRFDLTDKTAELTLRFTDVSLSRGEAGALAEPFPGGTGTDMDVEIGGTGFIPGFAEGLDGIKVGETRNVDVVFPAEYGAAELAGKAAVFEITAKGLKKPIDPVVDEEFAQKLGLANLDELKTRITETLQQEYDQLSRMNVKRKLLDALSTQAVFEVPESMVEAEFAQIWQRVESDMKAGNLDADDKGKDEDTLKSDYRAIAERRIRLGLLLSEIGRSNNIQVANEELSGAMRAEAGRYPGQERQVMEFFQKNPQAIENLRAPLFEEKVVDFMLELAQVTEKEVPAGELSADPEA